MTLGVGFCEEEKGLKMVMVLTKSKLGLQFSQEEERRRMNKTVEMSEEWKNEEDA